MANNINASIPVVNSKLMLKILSRQRDGLSVAHINAQSLFRKIYEFRENFAESGIDVICVSETWFYQSMHDSSVLLNGYSLHRADRDRQDVTRGGWRCCVCKKQY